MTYTWGRRGVLAVYAVIIVVPLAVVLFGTFKTLPQLFSAPFAPPTSPTLENYESVLVRGGLGGALRNSVLVTAASVTLTLFVGSLAAFACARISGRAGWVLFGFLILGMAVPAQASIVPQYVLFERLGLLDTLAGLVVINITATLPVSVFILTGFLKTLPRELFEASAIDGAGAWRTYASIALPLSRPALATTGIFLFVMHWNDLLYPLFFIQSRENRTLPLALLDFQGEFLTEYTLLFAGVVVASMPVVVAYVFLQRYFIAGLTAGSVRG